jgi:hypothetical protein
MFKIAFANQAVMIGVMEYWDITLKPSLHYSITPRKLEQKSDRSFFGKQIMKSVWTAGIGIIMTLGLILFQPGHGMAMEEIKYQVLENQGPFEIRSYGPFVVAETFAEGDFDSAPEEGFRRLFYFIAGHNRVKHSHAAVSEADSLMISMTAPIFQEKVNGKDRISLPLPAKYTLPTLPEPLDPQVKLREVPARLMAAVGYTGTWGQEQYSEQLARLLEWIGRNGFISLGEPIYARYDSPFLWFLSRHEVLIPVEK